MLHPRSACVIAFVALATLPAQILDADDRQPPSAPRARPATALALPDVLQVAIRQSPALTRAVIDIDLARADALAASGLDDVTLRASALFTRSIDWETVGTPGRIVENAAELGVGIERGLSTGGTVTANLSGQRLSETFKPDGLDRVESFDGVAASATASLVQPILRGYGARIARADVRRARIAGDAATLQQAAEALNVVRDVIIAYWRVAYAAQIVDIRAAGLKLAREQLRITERAVRTGTVSPTEALAAEQAIAVREQALLLAQVELSQLSLEFRRRVGLEISKDEIDIAPSTPLQTPTQTFDTDATIARALADNPLLALLDARGKGAEIEIEVSDDATRPRLDFHASVGSAGHSRDASQAVKQLGLLDNPSFTISLGYEQQIGARAARGATERARALRRRVRVDLEEARREIVVSVAHTIDVLRAAQKRIEVSDRAINLARRTLEIQQTRFLNGKSTNFDVLLRQDELQQASVSRALAVSDALAAEATVAALTGELLARHHIRIAAP